VIELFGVSIALLGLFVGFGLLIGILFGFFGMGGSFLVTPALLVLGYPTRVAVGSGLAFVFGTSVIATLKHRDLGQVDYKLGISMIVGTTVGLELGKELVLHLEALGLAEGVVSVLYVLLLGGIGVFVTRDALRGRGRGLGHDIADTEVEANGRDGNDEDEVSDLARRIQSYRLPPMLRLRGGVTVSLWVVLAVAFVTGLLSGFLGVGGGFIRMPALFYLIGVPVPVAIGTDLFEIVFSGGIGSFLYAQSGGVDLSIVVPLLAGSALGARFGSAATGLVDESEIKIYFGVMLLLGSIAVGLRQIGETYGIDPLTAVSFVLIIGAVVLVSGAVVYSSLLALRRQGRRSERSPTE